MYTPFFELDMFVLYNAIIVHIYSALLISQLSQRLN